MPRRPPIPLPCLLAVALAAGCEDLPERLIAENDKVALKAGLEAAEEAGRLAPLDEGALPDAAALAKVLRRPLSGAQAKLGPMTLTLTGTYAIEVPGGLPAPPAEDAPDAGAAPPGPPRPPSIDETRTLRLGPGDTFALDHLTTAGGGDLPFADDGRRCVWVDGRFFTAHRHGPYTAFEAVADEHHRCLDGALEPVAALVGLFADRLAVDVEGPDVVEGRDVLRVRLRPVPGGRVPPALPRTYGEDGLSEGDSPAIFGLRVPLVVGYTRVERFDGALLLDTATGQPLGGRIDARLPFEKAGVPATLAVSLSLSATPFEGAIEPPADPRSFGARQRIFDERRRLLGDRQAPADDAPTLPAPGDAPRLRVNAEGGLEADDGQTAPPRDEDRPVEAPAPRPTPMPTYDEDRPE